MAPAVYITAAIALRCSIATATSTKYYVCSAPTQERRGGEYSIIYFELLRRRKIVSKIIDLRNEIEKKYFP